MNFSIMAGGTGGHIFPGIAVAKVLLSRGHQVFWLGAKGGMEERIVKQYGLPITLLPIKALRGKGLMGRLMMPFRLLKTSFQAKKFFKVNAIDCTISMGGYVAGPGGLAARFSKTKLVVHEQNSVFGMTNRYLSKWADLVLTGFDLQDKYESSNWVGNPVRQSIEVLTKKSKTNGKLNVLVLGGSQGARSLNTIIPKVLSESLDAELIEVIHQCGKSNFEVTQNAYDGSDKGVQIKEFVHDMAKLYDWADFCVCRAGALTVAEVSCAMLPSLFVPYPHAVDDHQTYNALSVVEQGGGLIWDESKPLEEFSHQLAKLMDNSNRLRMTDKLSELRKVSVAEKISDLCEKVAA